MSENTDSAALGAMTVAELKAYAEERSIDLGGATKKADILAVLGATDEADAGGRPTDESGNPTVTRLDDDVTKPSTVAPGDAPHDTTDPTEQASTVGGDKAAAARAGHGTVNSAVPIRRPRAKATKEPEHRIEQYPQAKPNGDIVMVEHNIDTGATKVLRPVEQYA